MFWVFDLNWSHRPHGFDCVNGYERAFSRIQNGDSVFDSLEPFTLRVESKQSQQLRDKLSLKALNRSSHKAKQPLIGSSSLRTKDGISRSRSHLECNASFPGRNPTIWLASGTIVMLVIAVVLFGLLLLPSLCPLAFPVTVVSLVLLSASFVCSLPSPPGSRQVLLALHCFCCHFHRVTSFSSVLMTVACGMQVDCTFAAIFPFSVLEQSINFDVVAQSMDSDFDVVDNYPETPSDPQLFPYFGHRS